MRFGRFFLSRGEKKLYRILVREYRNCNVYAKVRMIDALDTLPQERPYLVPADYDFATKAHFDFVVVDRRSNHVLGAYEYDGIHHHTNPVQQQRDSRKDKICQRCGMPLYRVSGEVTPGTVPLLDPTTRVEHVPRPPTFASKTDTHIRARWLVATLGTSLGNLLGFILWWRSNEWWYDQGLSESQPQVFCLLPFITTAIGPLLAYVILTLLSKGHRPARLTSLFTKTYILNGLLLLISAVPLAIYYEVSSVKEIAVTANTWLLLLTTYLLMPSLIIGIYMARRFKKGNLVRR